MHRHRFTNQGVFRSWEIMDRYTEYLRSSTWRERRAVKLQQAKYRCQKCGEREGLEVHHKTYERLGNEANDDLIVLCKSCHWVADEFRRGKTGIIDAFYTNSNLSAPKKKRRKRHKRRGAVCFTQNPSP